MKTSLYSLLCIAIRLGAVLMAVHTVQHMSYLLMAWRIDGGPPWSAVAFAAVSMLFAGALWLWPGMLARFAVGRRGFEVFETPLSVATLKQLCFAVLGAWLAVEGTGGVSGRLVQIIVLKQHEDLIPPSVWAGELGWLTYYAVTAVIGMALLFGHRRFITWLRYAGTPGHGEVQQRAD